MRSGVGLSSPSPTRALYPALDVALRSRGFVGGIMALRSPASTVTKGSPTHIAAELSVPERYRCSVSRPELTGSGPASRALSSRP